MTPAPALALVPALPGWPVLLCIAFVMAVLAFVAFVEWVIRQVDPTADEQPLSPG